jgi:hypothetical protein
MGISLRHHVLALVASFLMLLVGLLVGVGLSSEPGLRKDLETLGQDFKVLRAENSTLSASEKKHEEFEQALLPTLVRSRLEGRLVPLLLTTRPQDNGPSRDAATQLEDALDAAGARPAYRVSWQDDFAPRAVAAYGGDAAAACEKATQAIARSIAQADAEGLRALRKRKLIRLQGDIPAAAPTGVVVLGGAETEPQSEAEAIDRPLVEALLAAGISRVVGCEASPAVSYVSTYREFDISTVDNVNLARGQFSVVMALAGWPGRYGDRGLFTRAFPEIK